MTDAEFIASAEKLLRNTRSACRDLLDLVDHLGQDQAFRMVQADVNYSRDLMVRMLRAARGAPEAELFSIAHEVSVFWK